MKRRLLLTILLSTLLSAPAFASFDAGLAAYQAGNYAQALEQWRPLAEQGDAKAQYHLGLMYFYGKGLPQDFLRATDWYRKAAEQGESNAQYELGMAYAKDLGVDRDYVKAISWCRLAAEKKHAKALSFLGSTYSHGKDLNPVAAYALFSISAELDSSSENRGGELLKWLTLYMTPQQISAGNALKKEMNRPGKLLSSLDRYLQQHPPTPNDLAIFEKKADVPPQCVALQKDLPDKDRYFDLKGTIKFETGSGKPAIRNVTQFGRQDKYFQYFIRSPSCGDFGFYQVKRITREGSKKDPASIRYNVTLKNNTSFVTINTRFPFCWIDPEDPGSCKPVSKYSSDEQDMRNLAFRYMYSDPSLRNPVEASLEPMDMLELEIH